MLEALKTSNKTVGIKQSMKAVESGQALKVFIARDADSRVTRDLQELCIQMSIEVVYVDSMKQLGRACGISVGASAACVKA